MLLFENMLKNTINTLTYKYEPKVTDIKSFEIFIEKNKHKISELLKKLSIASTKVGKSFNVMIADTPIDVKKPDSTSWFIYNELSMDKIKNFYKKYNEQVKTLSKYTDFAETLKLHTASLTEEQLKSLSFDNDEPEFIYDENVFKKSISKKGILTLPKLIYDKNDRKNELAKAYFRRENYTNVIIDINRRIALCSGLIRKSLGAIPHEGLLEEAYYLSKAYTKFDHISYPLNYIISLEKKLNDGKFDNILNDYNMYFSKQLANENT